jgi:DNA-directed RNA polymerase subunit RPC12/RpoP
VVAYVCITCGQRHDVVMEDDDLMPPPATDDPVP